MNLGKMQIILPVNPTEAEKGAASELALYIRKITGEEMTTIRENEKIQGQAYVYVGATDFAKVNNVTFPDNAFGEGWAIKAVDGNLVLCGGAVRGALYAVFHLLEDVLGVRWWNHWEESVPSLPEALIPGDYDRNGVPAMDYRDIFVWDTQPEHAHAVRNRLNGFLVYNSPQLGGREEFSQPGHVHTFNRYFPATLPDTPWMNAVNPEKIDSFQDHPEWHALTARRKRLRGKFCLSNEGLQNAFKDRLLRSIEYSYKEADAAGIARPRYFSISPADSSGSCSCPACLESVKRHGLSGHQLRFVNKLAEAVKPLYPEVYIETLTYWDYITPPIDDTKPADNVIIRFADIHTDILHDINHPCNKPTLDRLTRWAEICPKGNLYLWDYGVVYGPNGVFPSMYKISDSVHKFIELGLNGYFLTLEQCVCVDFWDMKYWLSAKFMENPGLDLRAMMDEFIDGYYGVQAGPYIRQYLDYMHEKAEACPTGFSFMSSVIGAAWLNVEDIIVGHNLFDDAFQAAAGDEVLLRRLRNARLGLDRVIVENIEKWTAEAAQKNIQLPFDEYTTGRRLAETFVQQNEFRGSWDTTCKAGLKLYEKYLPGYVPPEEPATQQAEDDGDDLPEHLVNAPHLSCIAAEQELAAIDEELVYTFTTDDFATFGYAVGPDSESPTGTSAVYDIGNAWTNGKLTADDLDALWAVSDDDPTRTLIIGIYSGTRDRKGRAVTNLFGALRASDIIADGKYHLYKFENSTAIAALDSVHMFSSKFHMFNSWHLQMADLPFELESLAGKPVDFYLSMKTTGDVTCKDLNNLPIYTVDRIIIVDTQKS